MVAFGYVLKEKIVSAQQTKMFMRNVGDDALGIP